MKRKFFKNKGFTLFELLAVLAILSIIAAIAVPRVMQTIKNARIEALKNNMQLIANSVQRYVTEEELTDCIGGMFVINPTVAEEDIDDDGASANEHIRYTGLGTQSDPWVLANDTGSSDIQNINIDPETNGKAKEIADHYVEGGIPAHIRVIVRADDTGKGHIEVSYGNVDDGSGEELLLNGITVEDMTGDDSLASYNIQKTFELESGEGHEGHATP